MTAGKKTLGCIALASFLALGGCASTLFFPAKPAEIAADSLIDDIWRDVPKPVAVDVDVGGKKS